MARAASSFPVPLSPVTSTGSSVLANRPIISDACRIAALWPMMSDVASAAARCRLRRGGMVFLKGRVQADEQPLVLDRPLHQKLRKSLDRQAREFVQRHPQHA